jgi:ADP-dependent NAD(P)H-hydrate dehydratase / NAD(P)H-hydrate epimerase
VLVADAAGAQAADGAAIAAGIPSRALMQRAGAAAAAELAHRLPDHLSAGVVVATGAGNNGGDGWVVAAALHAAGVRVRVVECVAARAPDAIAERDAAIAAGVPYTRVVGDLLAGQERIVVDAILGTGLRADAPLEGDVAAAVASLMARQRLGDTRVVALDVPSGMDATSGHDVAGLRCDLTLTFGTFKRCHLVARAGCGEIVLLDIGLGAHARRSNGAMLATPAWFRAALPAIPADAHKGTRKKVAIVGGAPGMAGAVILAARAALRSGAGLVKCVVAPESLLAVQEAEPSAIAAVWPTDDAALREVVTGWADAILVGPGLGRAGARALVERLLRDGQGPVVLDADALNAFTGEAAALAPLLAGRPALLTPHPAEFARLMGRTVDEVLGERFTLPARLAAETGAATLLKGVPTVVAAPDGATIVVAEGTPVLATGGAGDVLGGIAATLLAQTGDAALAGALAAYAHGRAARLVSARDVRGYTLDDVLLELPIVWSLPAPAPRPPVLAELPAVGEPT